MSAELPMLPGWDDEPAGPAPAWTEPIVLELRPVQRPMSMNTVLEGKSDGANRQRAAFIRSWRNAAAHAAGRAGIARVIAGQPAHVWLDVAFDQLRGRDEMNWTYCLKAAVDGLTKDAGCWPDDQRDWIRTWGCGWTKRPGGPHLLTIAPALPGTCVHTVLGSLW